jgi:hypothetical protein
VDAVTGEEHQLDDRGRKLLDEAIGYYQVASAAYAKGELRTKVASAEAATPPSAAQQ